MKEEEAKFFRTLEKGILRFKMYYSLDIDQKMKRGEKNLDILPGRIAFELL